jgi:hypothetical protein
MLLVAREASMSAAQPAGCSLLLVVSFEVGVGPLMGGLGSALGARA